MGRGKGLSGHQAPHHGDSDVWLTPPEIIRALGLFDLDPCAAPPPRPWNTAKEMISLPRDGLDMAWGGRVWLNPPFSQVDAWAGRMALYRRGTMLVSARTDTKWFHAHVFQKATSLLFLKGRLHFHYSDGQRAPFNSGAPIVLAAYGTEDSLRLQECGVEGKFVHL